jgi:2-polyprenyl-3-methyl-5-hydroxy-6-metoxy-1,4-benzoquinol methylase
MKNRKEKNILKFDQDILEFSGYEYTSTNQISSKFANERITNEILNLSDMSNKTVIDVGCGDGTYTKELIKGKPKYVLGIDPATQAINFAKKNNCYKNISYQTTNIYSLNKLDKHFDVAIVRGVLHHLYDYKKAIRQISKIANQIIVVEPNGYNYVLKIIEKVSKYHRDHEEKSYAPRELDKQFIKNHCLIVESKYCGLVPFFCSNIFTKILKILEPFIEKTPILNKLLCAVYIQKIQTQNTRITANTFR